jgi:hypothetical protein
MRPFRAREHGFEPTRADPGGSPVLYPTAREVSAMPRIPKFSSLDEEREFWDTHDTTDFLEELDEVKDVQFVRPPKDLVAFRLDRSLVRVIKRLARRQRVTTTELVRRWLMERAEVEARSTTASPKTKPRTSAPKRAA